METSQNTNNYKPDIYSLSDNYIEAKAFNFAYADIHPIHLSNSLTTTRHQLNLAALSANICGHPYRVISLSGFESALFNPVINETDGEVVMEETDISRPGTLVKIKRPEVIRVRYLTALQEVRNQVFTGMTARIIQHEIDNLNLFDWTTRASRFHKEQAIRKQKRLLK